MAAVSITRLPPYVHRNSSVALLSSSPVVSSLPFHGTTALSLQVRATAQRTGSEGGIIGSQDSFGAELLRRPSILERKEFSKVSEEEEVEVPESGIDWEKQILQETAPLVNFVRMILHSDRYASGDKLTPEHEKLILEKLLPFHPEFEAKIGCGVNYLTVGYHPDFEGSRCLFIVRKDGEMVDFSYRKCIRGLIKKSYLPRYAETFILKHFRRKRQ